MADWILHALSIGVAVAAVLVAVKAHATTLASTPKRVIDALDDLRKRVLDVERNLEAMDARAVEMHASVASLIETAEDVLTRVERKRRRTAAAESRLNRADGNALGPDPNSDAGLWARARAQGLV